MSTPTPTPAQSTPLLELVRQPDHRLFYPPSVPQMTSRGFTLVPLATVLYVMSCDVRLAELRRGSTTNAVFAQLATLRTAHFSHVSDEAETRAGSTRSPDGTISHTTLLRLSRYMHIGMLPSHDYYGHHVAVTVNRTALKAHRVAGRPAPGFEWDDNPPLGGFQDRETGNLNAERLLAALGPMRPDDDWTETQALAQFNSHHVSRYRRINPVIGMEQIDPQCVIWMPTVSLGNARPTPPFGSGYALTLPEGADLAAVAIVVNLGALSNADLIDVDASVHLSHAGAPETSAIKQTVLQVIQRIQSWLELILCGDGPGVADRRMKNMQSRGFVDQFHRPVRRYTSEAAQLRAAEAEAANGRPGELDRLRVKLRRGRPRKVVDSETAMREQYRADSRGMTKSALVERLMRAERSLEALRTDVSAFADLLDSLGDAGAALALRKVL